MGRIRKQTVLYSENHNMNYQKCSKYVVKQKNRKYQAKSRGNKKLKQKPNSVSKQSRKKRNKIKMK